MRRKGLLWQLSAAYLATALAAVAVFAAVSGRMLWRFAVDGAVEDLHARALMVGEHVPAHWPEAADACGRFGAPARTRITFIDPEGMVLCDSERDPALMDNHATRPEVIDALETGRGSALRTSRTLGEKTVYAAVSVAVGDEPVGVIRASFPARELAPRVRAFYLRTTLWGLGIAAVGMAVSLLFYGRIKRPFEMLKRYAHKLARGEPAAGSPAAHSSDLKPVADAMTEMAAELHRRISAAENQRQELESVLGGMVEGVVAVDNDERIININPTAANMLDTDPGRARGRSLQEVIRNPDLQEFIAWIIESGGHDEAEIILRRGEERVFRVSGVPLSREDGRAFGALAVLNDITRLRKLESVRRDFVANVSHELKTPITSIRGAVETLLDGAVRDPDDTVRFLEIIERQSDRMNAIIDDLLALAAVERLTDPSAVELEAVQLSQVLDAAVQAAAGPDPELAARIRIDCPGGLTARINRRLMEQAVANLVDNAVKYGGGSEVRVEAGTRGGELFISVSDRGPGIAAEHLPRVFERFYRVEKARSRKLGGTGLGLAIVKHIAQAHGGYASAQSAPDSGAAFYIFLPND